MSNKENQLNRIYQQMSQEQTPESLDQAILAYAENHKVPQPEKHSSSFLRRYRFTLSSAAAVMIIVLGYQQVPQQFEPQFQPQLASPQPQAPQDSIDDALTKLSESSIEVAEADSVQAQALMRPNKEVAAAYDEQRTTQKDVEMLRVQAKKAPVDLQHNSVRQNMAKLAARHPSLLAIDKLIQQQQLETAKQQLIELLKKHPELEKQLTPQQRELLKPANKSNH